MAMTLAWQYLTGQVKATDGRDEQRVEWPPHPGRVWLALAAQWFAGGESPLEERALEALRRAPEPQLWIPAITGVPRRAPGVYVPVNDTAGGDVPFCDGIVLGRTRQERFFCSLHVGEESVCALHWPDLALPSDLMEALARLVGRLTYLGQATSLIRAWVSEDDVPPPGTMVLDTLSAHDGDIHHLRGFGCGFSLGELRRWYLAGQTPVYRGWIPYGLKARTPGAGGERNGGTVSGNCAGQAVRVWSRSLNENEEERGALPSPWDPELTFFLQVSGVVVPITYVLDVVKGLRQEIARRCPLPLPSWLTGHDDDGNPLRDNTWYMGVFPVGHLGVEGSNGKLVGLALSRPRAIPRDAWEAKLAPLLQPKGFQVVLPYGEQGGKRISLQYPSRPVSGVFHPWLWTGESEGSRIWATTTPMVMDKIKSNYWSLGVEKRREEIIRSVSYSCRLAGLPEPVEVVARRDPWWAGSFPAWAKDEGESCFPPDRRFGRQHLFRFHVWLRFPVPVRGPLALGRLRFQGYGSFWACESEEGGAGALPMRQVFALRFKRNLVRPDIHVIPYRPL